jgi:3-methyl-2-oxobutanoate hydroxymethyltransferase|tara:strand:- start:496 stop:1299 length:804 start_codon:yes stop_codon:yes gene_type:complete
MTVPSSRPNRRVSVLDLAAAKQQKRAIAMMTAYDWPSGRLVDEAGVDCVLVGDSVAMVIAGHDSTIPATLDQMIYHGEIVSRAVSHAMVIVDLPFPLQHLGVRKAVASCAKILKSTNCQAIKLEGTAGQSDVIAGIVAAGIPVMGHVGLRPQAVHQLGGYRIQRNVECLMADAKAAEAAGACAVVLECIPHDIAGSITEALTIPTIGIGAGPQCDGQVLVYHDLIGLSLGHVPTFVRQYADMKDVVSRAIAQWRSDVASGQFPDASS